MVLQPFLTSLGLSEICSWCMSGNCMQSIGPMQPIIKVIKTPIQAPLLVPISHTARVAKKVPLVDAAMKLLEAVVRRQRDDTAFPRFLVPSNRDNRRYCTLVMTKEVLGMPNILKKQLCFFLSLQCRLCKAVDWCYTCVLPCKVFREDSTWGHKQYVVSILFAGGCREGDEEWYGPSARIGRLLHMVMEMKNWYIYAHILRNHNTDNLALAGGLHGAARES